MDGGEAVLGSGNTAAGENGSFRRGWTEAQVACVRSNQWRRGMMMTAASRGRDNATQPWAMWWLHPVLTAVGGSSSSKDGGRPGTCYILAAVVVLLVRYITCRPHATAYYGFTYHPNSSPAFSPIAQARGVERGRIYPGEQQQTEHRESVCVEGRGGSGKREGEGKGAAAGQRLSLSQVSASLQDLGGRPHVTLGSI